jgi:hypothetical protein
LLAFCVVCRFMRIGKTCASQRFRWACGAVFAVRQSSDCRDSGAPIYPASCASNTRFGAANVASAALHPFGTP